jgi:ABC-type nitrate/sulfonate/bicarbonate transport system ATPase subunit
MLALSDCAASWSGKPAIADIGLSLPAGACGCVVGPSGCGKSTLLLVAAGLKAQDRGSVLLDGTPVAPGDPRVALVLQDYGLFPWLTALDNAALGLRMRGATARAARSKAMDMLDRFGLAPRAPAHPAALSGGERQRVALARALCLSPAVLLMDEPFSALDAMSRDALQDLLLATVEREKLAVLLVTHSVEEAATLGRSIWLLAGAPGRITASLDNPGQGRPAFRGDPAWFGTVTALRVALRAAGSPVRA